jgi:hypothetical protein
MSDQPAPRRPYGLLVGLAVTPPALLLAIMATGGGHGDYVLTRLLFPYSMLLTLASSDTIALPSMVLAFLQFPIYGWLLDEGRRRERLFTTAIILFVVHGIAANLCFAGLLPFFS